MATIIEEPVGGLQPNLAPLDQLKQAARGAKLKPVKFHEFIKSRYADLQKEREDVWREIYAAAHLISLFCRGKQFVHRGRFNNGWRPYADLKDTGTDELRGINLTRFYIDNIVVKWVQSSADLIIRAAKDTDDAIMSARAGDIVIEHYEREWYTPTFRQREARLAILCGTYARRLYYCDDYSAKARRPVLGMVELAGGGTAFCPECEHAGTPDQFEGGMCPACGGGMAQITETPPIQVESVRGIEEYSTGTIKCDSVPLYNLRYDLAESLEESSYLIYSRRVRNDVLMGQLHAIIKLGQSKSKDPGLDAATALQYAGPAVGGRSQSGVINKSEDEQQEYTDLTELWLQPEMYGDVKLDQPVKTVAGQEIPAGPLSDSFPDGMCIMGADSMKTVLYVFNENHRDHWVSGQYHLDPISGAGDGLVDIIEIQRQFNLANSQIFAQIRAQATPAILFDKDLISGDKSAYLGNPKMNVPVDLSRLPEQRHLSQAIHQLTPGQIPGHMIEYTHTFLNNMFQLTAHTTDFSGGLPGVNNSTATGAKIGDALAQSLHSPQLQMLAEVNRRTALLALKLFKRYCPDETYLRVAGRDDAEQGMWLKGADLDTSVRVEIIPESWLPQSGFERRERLKEFITFFGNVEGLETALARSPKLVGDLIRMSDIEIDVADWDSAMRLGRKRIEQMKKALPMAMELAQTIDPAVLESMTAMGADPKLLFANVLLNAIEPKPNIREMGLETQASYYQDWLTTDEGLAASPILIEAVNALADNTLRFVQMGGAAATAAQPPPMMGMPPMGGGAPAPGGFPEMAPGGGQSQPEAAAAANMGAPQVGAMAQ